MSTSARVTLPLSLACLILRYSETKLRPRLVRPEINFGRLRNVLVWLRQQCNVTRWCDILPMHWCDYNTAREKDGIGPEMRRKELQDLVAFIRWCEQQEPDGPRRSHLFDGEAPPVPLPEPKALNEAEEHKLLLAASFIRDGGPRLETCTGRAAWIRNWPPGSFYTLCLLGLRLGLRPGELQYLAWNELQLESGTPYVALREQRSEDGKLVRRLKNRLAGTPLALPAECFEAVMGLRVWHLERGTLRPFVFAVPSVRRKSGWEAANYDFIWDGLRVQLGLPWLNCYTLRHTFATRLIERDPPMDPHFRRRLMRHVFESTAERYYIERVRDGKPLDVQSGQLAGEGQVRHEELI